MRKLSESIFNAGIKRNQGDEVRKEDSVNNMSKDKLLNFIDSKYHIKIYSRNNRISFPLNSLTLMFLDYDCDSCLLKIDSRINLHMKKLYKELKNRYILTHRSGLVHDDFSITPKNGGEVNNSFLIEVIECCIEYNGLSITVFESIFNAGIKRNQGEEVRKEDGRIVHTSLGVDMFLKNPNYTYESLIKALIDGDEVFETDIDKVRNCKLSPEEIANIRKFEAPYAYMIYDGMHGDSLVVQFASHYNVDDYLMGDFKDEISEEDYISICKCVATKLREVGGNLEYVPQRRDSWLILNREEINQGWGRSIEKYEQKYVLCLISESKVYHWLCDNEDAENYSLDFREDIISNFPELEEEDFIAWSYNGYGINIALPLKKDILIKFQEYKSYTENWFRC